MDIFILQVEKKIRHTSDHEKYCYMKIDCTDIECLRVCVEKLMTMDKTGELKNIFARSLMKANLKDN